MFVCFFPTKHTKFNTQLTVHATFSKFNAQNSRLCQTGVVQKNRSVLEGGGEEES